jgi:hypothetical protein
VPVRQLHPPSVQGPEPQGESLSSQNIVGPSRNTLGTHTPAASDCRVHPEVLLLTVFPPGCCVSCPPDPHRPQDQQEELQPQNAKEVTPGHPDR